MCTNHPNVWFPLTIKIIQVWINHQPKVEEFCLPIFQAFHIHFRKVKIIIHDWKTSSILSESIVYWLNVHVKCLYWNSHPNQLLVFESVHYLDLKYVPAIDSDVSDWFMVMWVAPITYSTFCVFYWSILFIWFLKYSCCIHTCSVTVRTET